jgi:hypothetical protein
MIFKKNDSKVNLFWERFGESAPEIVTRKYVDDVIKFAKVRQEPKDPKEDHDEDSEKLVKLVQAIEKLTTSNEKGARNETQ